MSFTKFTKTGNLINTEDMTLKKSGNRYYKEGTEVININGNDINVDLEALGGGAVGSISYVRLKYDNSVGLIIYVGDEDILLSNIGEMYEDDNKIITRYSGSGSSTNVRITYKKDCKSIDSISYIKSDYSINDSYTFTVANNSNVLLIIEL